jgi:hypothetical protein
MDYLSCTARRTILCQTTSLKQSKNNAKYVNMESMKHINGLHHSASPFLPHFPYTPP